MATVFEEDAANVLHDVNVYLESGDRNGNDWMKLFDRIFKLLFLWLEIQDGRQEKYTWLTDNVINAAKGKDKKDRDTYYSLYKCFFQFHEVIKSRDKFLELTA